MLSLLCRTKNNIDVFVDLESSHAATHFVDTPHLKIIVIEVLKNYYFTTERIRFEVDMKRIIGKSALVKTTGYDEIVYALRPNRSELMRFVRNRVAENTTYVTLDLRKLSNNSCELFTAYVGRNTPKFPGHSKETPDSKPFWNTHALVWGLQDIIPGSETSTCPWT